MEKELQDQIQELLKCTNREVAEPGLNRGQADETLAFNKDTTLLGQEWEETWIRAPTLPVICYMTLDRSLRF